MVSRLIRKAIIGETTIVTSTVLIASPKGTVTDIRINPEKTNANEIIGYHIEPLFFIRNQ